MEYEKSGNTYLMQLKPHWLLTILFWVPLFLERHHSTILFAVIDGGHQEQNLVCSKILFCSWRLAGKKQCFIVCLKIFKNDSTVSSFALPGLSYLLQIDKMQIILKLQSVDKLTACRGNAYFNNLLLKCFFP